MQRKVDSNRITCEKKGFIGFQFNHRRFSSLGRNCRDSPRRSALDTHTQYIYEAHRIVHTFRAHTYVCKALIVSLPRVTQSRLLSNFCQRQDSPERPFPLYSPHGYYLAGVTLYFTCKLFFPRVYLSAPRPFVRPFVLSATLPPLANAGTPKIFMCTDTGF